MRPREASACLVKGDVRESGGYGKRGQMCISVRCGGRLHSSNYGGGRVERGLLSRLYTADECCSEHVCHCAKFEQNQPSYSDLATCTWPPSAILDIRGERTCTTPHVAGPSFKPAHQI